MRSLKLAAIMMMAVLAAAANVQTAFAQPAAPQEPPIDQIVSDNPHRPLAYTDWGKKIMFEMKVKDRLVLAMLDTAAADSLIDLGLAKDLDLSLTPGPTPLITGAGNLTVWLAQGAEITVPGQFKLRASMFRVADLSPTLAPPGRKVQFVFGQDFLKSMVLLVRPQQHTFQLAPTGAFKRDPGDDEIALSGLPPTISVSVDDKVLAVTVDTGLDRDLCLTPTAWTKLALEISAVVRTPAYFPTGEWREVRLGKIKDLKIGPSTFKDIDVCEADLPGYRNDGLIGYGLLSRFDFAMDQAAGKLWLTPKTQEVTPAVR